MADATDPNSPPDQVFSEDTFGFEGEQKPRDEKYNTMFLVQNLKHENNFKKYAIIGVIAAAVLGAVTWLTVVPSPQEAPAENKQEAAAPAAKAQPAAKAEEAPAAEKTANAAPGKPTEAEEKTKKGE